MIIVNYVVAVLLLVLGLYAVCTQKNLIKVVLGLGIIDYGINLLIVSVGFNDGGTAPIFTISDLLNGISSNFFVDPVPQALTLTSIVIGACVDAMALALVIMIYRKYKTVNADEVRRIRG
ncbi:MAG: NADH-quinone oxidoreductase subunit K [Oscillospiraceae bacterium]|nr:NADH-quinone oxidoreductase subunit K [Oscillospiraceae bacterium]MBQ4544252.1 NADH-quinone oxidoreductase subunit K [Oscillospiraceae bacterium]MBQ6902184.1 NADH-quinone oxidoreductase subunit K [Oscillospiraceae bacterium]